MRNWSDIFNHADIKSCSLETPYGRFSSCSWTFNIALHFPHPVFHSRLGRVFRRLLRGKRSAFTRAFEPHCTRAGPGNDVSLAISNRNYSIVKRRFDMGNSVIDVLPFFSLNPSRSLTRHLANSPLLLPFSPYRATWTLSGARVGPGPLSPDR